jgi:hypothetical protein
MAALVLNRFEERNSQKMIIESLKETALTTKIGVHNKAGWYWYQHL